MHNTSGPSRDEQDNRATRGSRLPVKAAVCGLAVGIAAGLVPTLAAPTVQAAPKCPPYIAIGIPGSNQGAEHYVPGTETADATFGEQVADVHASLESSIGEEQLGATAVGYPAIGVDWLGPAFAKLSYDSSIYKESKDAGYAEAYRLLSKKAQECPPSTKFFLIGYSQGAHIAGDLAQTVFDGGGPVDRSRIAGVALIADPAYNGASPGATEFIFDNEQIGKDPDHWQIHGSLGTRKAFEETDPVISICIYGDPICDNNSVGAGGLNAKAAADKAWMHTELYTDHAYAGAAGLSTWLGTAIADKAKG